MKLFKKNPFDRLEAARLKEATQLRKHELALACLDTRRGGDYFWHQMFIVFFRCLLWGTLVGVTAGTLTSLINTPQRLHQITSCERLLAQNNRWGNCEEGTISNPNAPAPTTSEKDKK